MFGPLFSKELIELARRRRYYLLRVVAGAATLLLILNAELPNPIPMQAGNIARTTAYLAQWGRSVFETWAQVVVVGLLLCVPAFSCGLVAGEKQRRTFDVLLTSMLTDREILLGKAASRFFVTLWMVASTLPVLAVVSLYGGVDGTHLALAAVSMTATAMFVTALSLYYSTVTDKTYAAQFRTYVLLGTIWYFIPYGVPQLVGLSGVDDWLGLFTPFEIGCHIYGLEHEAGNPALVRGGGPVARPAFPMQTNPNATGGPLAWLPRLLPAALYFVMYASLSWWLFRRTHRILRRHLVPRGGSRLVKRLTNWFYGLVEAVRRAVEYRRHLPVLSAIWRYEQVSRDWGPLDEWGGLSQNPLMYRNRRANVYDPQHYIMGLQLLGWIGFILLLWYGLMVDVELLLDQGFHHFLLIATAAGLHVVATLLAAASLAREKQFGSWECLLTTPIRPFEYLSSTVLGVLRRLFPTLLLLGFGIAAFGFNSTLQEQLLRWAQVMAALLVYIIVSGVLASLASRSILEALVKLALLLIWTHVAALASRYMVAALTLLSVLILSFNTGAATLLRRQRYAAATYLKMLALVGIVSILADAHAKLSLLEARPGDASVLAAYERGDGASAVNLLPIYLFQRYFDIGSTSLHLWGTSMVFALWFCSEFDRLAGRISTHQHLEPITGRSPARS